MSYLTGIARSVVRYDPAHRTALRAFQRAHFGATARHADDACAEWLFERNPHKDSGGPSLWVCVRDGIVVGQQASIPVVLKVGSAEQRAAWLVDWMIHPDWRLRGVSIALLNANSASNELMMGLGLEDVAYKTVAKAGWTDVGRLSLFVRPLDVHACARIVGLPALVSMVAPRVLVGASARLAGRVARSLSGISMTPIAAFDERVDAIWKAASPDYDVLVKRDYESLRWRYDDGPFRALYARYYFQRKGETIGYAVLRLAYRQGHMFGRVVDYLVPRRWVRSALALIIEELDAKGASAVFFEQWDPRSQNIMRALGCVRARPSHRLMFRVPARESAVANALARTGSWFLTPGDSDFDHVLIATDYESAHEAGEPNAAAPS